MPKARCGRSGKKLMNHTTIHRHYRFPSGGRLAAGLLDPYFSAGVLTEDLCELVGWKQMRRLVPCGTWEEWLAELPWDELASVRKLLELE